MTLEEIKQRGFKKEAGYRLSYMYDWSHLYMFRLKEKNGEICMEERISNHDTEGTCNQVVQSYHSVKSWSKNGVYPVGINSIPRKATMTMQMSDGSYLSFNHHMNFVLLKEGEIDIEALVDNQPIEKKESVNTDKYEMLQNSIEYVLTDSVITKEERKDLENKAKSLGISSQELQKMIAETAKRMGIEVSEPKGSNKTYLIGGLIVAAIVIWFLFFK